MVLKSIIALSIINLVHSWYPPDCCSENDCKPVPCSEITSDLKYKGLVFPKKDVSPDKQCHVCISNMGTPRCIFIYYKGSDA